MEKVDFVILWVDGNDKKWLNEKNKYLINDNKKTDNNAENRYRDWDLLKYWFRGIEKYANWVNKIYFVTWGHVPKWLNTENDKIHIVKHEEFMPKEILPTFNSNVIQYYLDRIDGISDKFVMFDDDQFVLNKIFIEDFFIGDKICEEFSEKAIFTSKQGDVYPHSILNNLQVINTYYKKRNVYKKNIFKYFNIKYGLKNNINTLMSLQYSYFIGFNNPHICQAYSKDFYKLFWKYCESDLKKSSNNKFRRESDLTTFLIRYLVLVEGNFVPRTHKFGMRVELGKDNKDIYQLIKKQKYKVLCVNDSNVNIDFEKTKYELINCFEEILPQKSKFEK